MTAQSTRPNTRSLTRASAVPGPSASAATRVALRDLPLTRSPTPTTRPVTPATPFALPPTIWDENSGYNSRSDGSYGPHRFTNAIMAAATSGSAPPPLRVRGSDVDAAADHFSELLDAAGRRGDYTDLLTEDRGFGL
jgi:hypothetical protein